MTTRNIILALTLLLLPANPVAAHSDLAEDFLFVCRQSDTIFPPEDWSPEDLRSAALEILDAYENDGDEAWAVFFCLITLGHTRCSEDVPRILAYEDTMTGVVLRSLRGFPDPVAIDCLLRWAVADNPDFRELAIRGIANIDFEELEDPGLWRVDVVEQLQSARETETVELLIELIDEVITAIESSGSLQESG